MTGRLCQTHSSGAVLIEVEAVHAGAGQTLEIATLSAHFCCESKTALPSVCVCMCVCVYAVKSEVHFQKSEENKIS